ncbi:MAG TPA: YjbE family putative metal transport protein [Roseiarcus sp.]|nr:YjbE family putative metal transport protein [Roseiarcus sp.]
MDFGDGAAWLVIPVQIFFVDLLLGADNALLIALACRSLGPEDTRKAIVFGAGGAILLRLVLTVLASSLLALPLVKLVGAWLLIVIALNVTAEHASNGGEDRPSSLARGDLWSAATVIVVADTAMSLDNVVALAAIARGNFWLLAAGVALSIPVLAYGGLILTTLLKTAPVLVAIGAALLGWIAGDMAVSDPLLANWANANAPGLVAIAPALGAAFVFLNGWLAPGRAAPSSIARSAPLRAVKPAALASAPRRPSAPALERTEPRAPSEPAREDRAALIGVLIFAAIAGLVLLVVSYLDSLN